MPDEENQGVVFARSEINFRQIEDGLSNTYMVGEKYMSTDNYDDGLDEGDNEPAFAGKRADGTDHPSVEYRLRKGEQAWH